MGTLFVVATPIGNLEDISDRAQRVLGEVDFILCEDTRQTIKLLERNSIKKPLVSYHQHSKLKKIDYVMGELKAGKSIALVSDAGTPGISDPGNVLVSEVVKQLGDECQIVPIPGASAVTAIASVAGFPMDRFAFYGFIPLKKGRQKMLEKITSDERSVIFYESPYRIIKTLSELADKFKEASADKTVVVGRELTKKFETIYRGDINHVIKDIEQDKVKGEFVVAISA